MASTHAVTQPATTTLKMTATRIPWTILFIVAFFGVVSCDNERKSGYPSDSDTDAINFFKSHSADFDKLRSLIEHNPFMLLNAERKESIPPNAFIKAPEVKAELLQLMADLQLQWINGVESDWGIRLIFLSKGMVMGGTTKSFFYSKAAPKNLVPSTEGFVPNTTESSSVFRKIDSDWYLQFEWGG